MPPSERFDRFIQARTRLGDLLEAQVAGAVAALAERIEAGGPDPAGVAADPGLLRAEAKRCGQRARLALNDLSFRALQGDRSLASRLGDLHAALKAQASATDSLTLRIARALQAAAGDAGGDVGSMTSLRATPGLPEGVSPLGPEVIATAITSALGTGLENALHAQAGGDGAWIRALVEPLAQGWLTSVTPVDDAPADGLTRAAHAVQAAVEVAPVLGEHPLTQEREETRFRQATGLPSPEVLAEDAVAFAHNEGVAPYSREARRRYFEALRVRMEQAGASAGQKAALDLVAGLFDYVVEDGRLPPAAQPLLWRMQYPSVMLASLDSGYLGDDRRSVRRLVEHLAAISVAYAEDVVKGSELYKRLETVVRAVEVVSNALHGRSLVLGDQVQKEYRRATRGMTQIVARIEKERVALEATPGRRNRRDYSRRPSRDQERKVTVGIEQALRERMARHEVPDSVRQFLLDVWSRHLRTAVLRDGEGSPSHRVALQVVDDLLWSLDASGPRPSRSQLASRIPPLIRLLTQGVSDIGARTEEFRPFLDELFLIHLRRMQRTPEQPSPAVALPASQALPASDSPGIVTDDRVTGGTTEGSTGSQDRPVFDSVAQADSGIETLSASLDSAESLPQVEPPLRQGTPREPPVVLATRGIQRLDHPEDAVPSLETVETEVTVQAPEDPDDGVEPADDPQLLAQIGDIDLSDFPVSPDRPRWEVDRVLQSIVPGAWLEFRGQEGSAQQLKVAWINPRRTVYLLVRRPDRRAVSLRVEDLRDRLAHRRAQLVR